MSAICGSAFLPGHFGNEIVHQLTGAMTTMAPGGIAWWSNDRVALGCCRLRDTDDWCARAENGRPIAIVADARLDNRLDLARQLHANRTADDVDLLLLAYEKWGVDCVGRLLGEWAFALWDQEKNQLVLARDQLGSRPLYYNFDGRRIVFASTLQGLLDVDGVARTPDLIRLAQTLVCWQEPSNRTQFEEIQEVLPAHVMTFSEGRIHERQYWDLDGLEPLRLKSDKEYVEAFLEVYNEAVACRLGDGNHVGTTLSGGLDSSSVTALAAAQLEAQGKKLEAYAGTPLFASDDYKDSSTFGDESPFAAEVAARFGNTRLHCNRSDDCSPLQGIREALQIMPETLHGGTNAYWLIALFRAAAGNGIRQLLIGSAGNATVSWSGIPGYASSLFGKRQWNHLWNFAWERCNHRPLSSLKFVLSQSILPRIPFDFQFRYARLRSGWRPWSSHTPLNLHIAEELHLIERMRVAQHEPAQFIPRDTQTARKIMIKPGGSYAGNFWYQAGRRYGLSVCDPTMDKRVVEFCMRVPDEQYYCHGQDRWLIRRAMKDLIPESVRLNNRRGSQGVDLLQRIRREWDDWNEAVESLTKSAAAVEVLNLPKMREVLDRVKTESGCELRGRATSFLGRGVMAGLFLSGYATKRSTLIDNNTPQVVPFPSQKRAAG